MSINGYIAGTKSTFTFTQVSPNYNNLFFFMNTYLYTAGLVSYEQGKKVYLHLKNTKS